MNTMPSQSHLMTLRTLMPRRALTFGEAWQRAEMQACRLLELEGMDGAPIPAEVISDQPRVRVETAYLSEASGDSRWLGNAWLIQLNASEPEVRRRFTLAHEYKHVLDAPFEDIVYATIRGSGEHHPLVEQICDYFAACLLMPKMLVKRAWGQGVRDPHELAQLFVVSPQAMHIRLITLGLVVARRHRPVPLRATPPTRRRGYRRQLSTSFVGAAP